MKFTIGQKQICFYYESESYTGVQKTADKVRNDIKKVTDVLPDKISKPNFLGGNAVLFGTLGRSPVLEQLEQSGKADFSCLRGKREVYSFQLIKHPFDGVEMALVIAGSDKRGTIYGLFHLSECMGVSPLTDWSDVRPEKKNHIILTESINKISKEPSVKYRGIFINDEWPAFGTWCNYHFGGFNADMYEHVFELILRLKGNYLWPAMWSARFSDDGPDLKNAELADEWGIVIGSSHHEPCMRNGEEYKYLRGKDSLYGDAWDFRTNRNGIKKFWEDGLQRNHSFENIITMGMRGEFDTAILGENSTLQENIDLLRDVLTVQNQLIKDHINEDLQKVSRLFVLFTEVEAFFYGDETAKGLMDDEQLDGVTLMLTDDNFGNLRSVPTEEMRRHKGGYGLYYHFDFHGGAYAYDWMNTNDLPKIWEQLTMAYDYGIRDVWVVNIGDICFLEYPLSYFFDLAYDMEKWGSEQINKTSEYTKMWIEKQFHGAFRDDEKEMIHRILDEYTKVNHNRKPEILNDAVYHAVHYDEASLLLDKAENITGEAELLKEKCPEWALPAFYELVYFPTAASFNILRMWLLASRSRFFAEQNRIETNYLADEIASCIEKDRQLTEEFHAINNRRWYGMGLSEHIGFISWVEEGNKYPQMIHIEPANKPRMIVAKSDSSDFTLGLPWTGKTLYVRDFLRPDVETVCFDIACGSK
ncbi:MAG: glycosyl hydrolase 115 family protein, partial [Lachnoclostridium sp.]|nr:glycosyl hydrolase 115 family protein [Lachnoclostridium sp.]